MLDGLLVIIYWIDQSASHFVDSYFLRDIWIYKTLIVNMQGIDRFLYRNRRYIVDAPIEVDNLMNTVLLVV